MLGAMLDSAPTGVGTDRDLLGRIEQVSVVVIEKYGGNLSAPISRLGPLEFSRGWDMEGRRYK